MRDSHQFPFGKLFLICVVWIIFVGLASYLPMPWSIE